MERNNYRLKFERQAKLLIKLKSENKTLTNKLLHCASNNNKSLLKSPKNNKIVRLPENPKNYMNLSYLTSSGLLFSAGKNNESKNNTTDFQPKGINNLKSLKDLKEDPFSFEFLKKSVDNIKNGIIMFFEKEWDVSFTLKRNKSSLSRISQDELAQKEKKTEKKLFEIKTELSKRRVQKYKPIRNQYFKFDSPIKPIHSEKEKFKQKLIHSVFGSIEFDFLQLKQIPQLSNEKNPLPLEPNIKKTLNESTLRNSLLNYNDDFSSKGALSSLRRRNTYSFLNTSFQETEEFRSFLEKENSELDYLKEQRRKTIAREEQNKNIKSILEKEIKKPSSSKYINLDTTQNNSKNSFYSDCGGLLKEEDSFYFRKIRDLKKNAESVKNLVHSISNSQKKNIESLMGKESINDFFSEKDISLNFANENIENIKNFITNSEISILPVEGDERKRRSRKERNAGKK